MNDPSILRQCTKRIPFKSLLNMSLLDQQRPVAQVSNCIHVVADQDHGGSGIPTQRLKKVEYFGLDCHVQGRGRFVKQ